MSVNPVPHGSTNVQRAPDSHAGLNTYKYKLTQSQRKNYKWDGYNRKISSIGAHLQPVGF